MIYERCWDTLLVTGLFFALLNKGKKKPFLGLQFLAESSLFAPFWPENGKKCTHFTIPRAAFWSCYSLLQLCIRR